MTTTQFCHVQVLDHMALEPRRLLEAYDTGMNSENECEADPEQTNNVRQHSKKHFHYLLLIFTVTQ